ncbi:Alpha-ketoglutaric semialdehyde dehydrogenase [Marinomonas spartinae]|uniref:Alpha-ketoglutaric semialdehyde dehydrogenase n=1 Tax=Marinomonas spartinae TaxID=1792290 RepID=A0A1A8T5N0_9GAMM|nr:aldehyde dehydrogenase (NADP(+)) [Marinomonas spartinae]SBS27681.1 Alpha-ketoglutaric semialdehyde dehydrogenase [Marinomonas spartinae]SBS30094.1 Alpha-ketoglutaric semialdehyde dehydrogenase [Marinomonas spartinae]
MQSNTILKGTSLIAGQAVLGSDKALHGINPATNEALEPGYLGCSKAHVDQAVDAAWQAFDLYRALDIEKRASFLECIADEILALGDTLVERAVAESGLLKARIEGERGRTMGQLRLFASVIRMGGFSDARIDPAMPDRTPLPRADLRLQKIPLGPVAVFGASNFPLAFSVAGGDTASALAAGCPVVAKAHPAHPGTSELIGRAIQSAVEKSAMPAGVFSLLFVSDNQIAGELVAHPYIKAVGFTGSRKGGLALVNIAQRRPEPIPVYAEMSSINPVFVMPSKLATQAKKVASGFVTSLAMGAGQFCTNPGLVVALEGDGFDDFLAQVVADTRALNSQTMLTGGIYDAYCAGVAALEANNKVTLVAKGQQAYTPNQCQAHVFVTEASAFLADLGMEDEVFGSTSLIIKCRSLEEYKAVAEHVEGQLTITIQMNDEDVEAVRTLLPVFERKAGRLLCNGYPTGVEVCQAMVHGGPFPATSDSRSTSVGSSAIDRFLRPVCYQDFPEALIPCAIKDSNPMSIPQLVDGKLIV